jgi:hypothetical protein
VITTALAPGAPTILIDQHDLVTIFEGRMS